MILISCCFLEGKKLYNVFLFITCHVIIGDLKSIRSIIISEWESKLYLATTKPKKNGNDWIQIPSRCYAGLNSLRVRVDNFDCHQLWPSVWGARRRGEEREKLRVSCQIKT
jgi:hypothetical protein